MDSPRDQAAVFTPSPAPSDSAVSLPDPPASGHDLQPGEADEEGFVKPAIPLRRSDVGMEPPQMKRAKRVNLPVEGDVRACAPSKAVPAAGAHGAASPHAAHDPILDVLRRAEVEEAASEKGSTMPAPTGRLPGRARGGAVPQRGQPHAGQERSRLQVLKRELLREQLVAALQLWDGRLAAALEEGDPEEEEDFYATYVTNALDRPDYDAVRSRLCPCPRKEGREKFDGDVLIFF
jgi:hypothetical protein